MHKAHGTVVRGAGPWPTRRTPKVRTAREVPCTERPSRRVPWRTRHIRFRPFKKQVLTRKAHEADVRGAGLWPTGVHEASWNAAHQVPLIQMRVLVRKAPEGSAPLKAGSDAQGARGRCVLDVREVPWNAAHQVLHHPTRHDSRYRGCRRVSSPAATSRWTKARRR